MRKAFTCEPQNVLVVSDYGQLELRLLAHMTRCKSMIDVSDSVPAGILVRVYAF